jgi:hypothetical protein
MRRTSLGFAVALVIVAVLPSPTRTQRSDRTATKPISDPDWYAVYASLVPSIWPVTAAHAKTLVFQQETGTTWPCQASGQALDADWRAAIDSYAKENGDVRTLVAGFPMTPAYVVVPKADIQAYFSAVPPNPGFGWADFFRQHPDSGGYIAVSAIGFNPSKTKAMVTMGWACGSTCGGGSHYTLEKANGAWNSIRVPGRNSCTWAI